MRYIIKEMAILQEAKNLQTLREGKARWTAKLQLLDEYSYNGKLYKSEPMLTATNEKKEMIERGGFVGELDHPIDPSTMRILNVLYQNAGHLFREIYNEGNAIYGVLENTSNKVGMDEYALIVKDRIPVGYSLRALGDVRETRQGQEVYKDIDLVTWDCVSNPGYSGCLLQEILDYKHLESRRKMEDLINLEEYVHGSSEHRQQLLMESKSSKQLVKVIKGYEQSCLFESKDFEVKVLKNRLALETRKKLFSL